MYAAWQTLCQEILKELRCLDKAWDHKVIDIWLLMLIYMSSEPLRKSVEKIFRKKIVEGLIQEGLFDQCIRGNKELVQVKYLIKIFNNLLILPSNTPGVA